MTIISLLRCLSRIRKFKIDKADGKDQVLTKSKSKIKHKTNNVTGNTSEIGIDGQKPELLSHTVPELGRQKGNGLPSGKQSPGLPTQEEADLVLRMRRLSTKLRELQHAETPRVKEISRVKAAIRDAEVEHLELVQRSESENKTLIEEDGSWSRVSSHNDTDYAPKENRKRRISVVPDVSQSREFDMATEQRRIHRAYKEDLERVKRDLAYKIEDFIRVQACVDSTEECRMRCRKSYQHDRAMGYDNRTVLEFERDHAKYENKLKEELVHSEAECNQAILTAESFLLKKSLGCSSSKYSSQLLVGLNDEVENKDSSPTTFAGFCSRRSVLAWLEKTAD